MNFSTNQLIASQARQAALWQWFAAGVVVLASHALVLQGLHSPASFQKPKVVSRIEVVLIAPQQSLPFAAQQPAKHVETNKSVETRIAQPEPVRIPQAVATPAGVSSQNDTAPSAASHVPTPDQAASPKAARAIDSATESEPIAAPRFNAAYLHNATPVYPAGARRAGYEGTVLIRARIQADGNADRVEIKKSSGYSVLDQAALEAVRKWRFIPAKRVNEAVVEWVDIPLKFKLED